MSLCNFFTAMLASLLWVCPAGILPAIAQSGTMDLQLEQTEFELNVRNIGKNDLLFEGGRLNFDDGCFLVPRSGMIGTKTYRSLVPANLVNNGKVKTSDDPFIVRPGQQVLISSQGSRCVEDGSKIVWVEVRTDVATYQIPVE